MPLHDWADDQGWDSVHLLWIAEIVRWLQPRLPAGYRAFPGSAPVLTVGTGEEGRPDVSARGWGEPPVPRPGVAADPFAPDFEAVAAFATEPLMNVHVTRRGQLVAAVEIVSPRNKDRRDARRQSAERYAGYLRRRVHLMAVDVLPLPHGFSFADAIAADVGLAVPPCPAPFAASYRVGEWQPDDRTVLAGRQSPLRVGEPLPTLPLALTLWEAVPIDLEATYSVAAALAYVDELRG